MLSILGIGFLIGLRHAFEADHVAAVATLATNSRSTSQTVKLGMVWGLGHTLMLLLCTSLVFWLGTSMSEQLAKILEFFVGLMLVGLGVDVWRRLLRDRIHFHIHQHSAQSPHVHAHSHQGESNHALSTHAHDHPTSFPYRALFVGCMHGIAGSAALILLTMQSVISPLTGLLYVVLFGLGSVAGMAVLSVVIALPLRHSEKTFTWLHNGLHGCIGFSSMVLGFVVIYRTSSFLLS